MVERDTEDLLVRALEYAQREVRTGLYAREEVIDFVYDFLDEEGFPSSAAAAVDEAIAIQQEAQKFWRRPTDCDWLDQVFADARRVGILVCQACGSSRSDARHSAAEAAKHAGEPPVWGDADYSIQDAEAATADGDLALWVGVREGRDPAARVAEELERWLRSAEFTTAWNGQVELPLFVLGLTWQTRLP